MTLKLDDAGARPLIDEAYIDNLRLDMMAPGTADAVLSEDIRWTQIAHKRSAESRNDRIATLAYSMSEARSFEPGHDVEDWLLAQAQIDALDASSTLLRGSTPPRPAHVAWDEDASPNWGDPIDTVGAALDQLRVAVTELYKAVNSALQDECESAREYVRRASVFLQAAPFATSLGGVPISNGERSKPIRGGLAPWQIRRVKTHIEANVDATIRIKELAQLVNLSSFHFFRAFRESFGDSPHGYVMRRRVERAQGLMLTTTASLGQIAADCGLADQAHFNKLFRRFVGETPGAWRRARALA
jgi:AraC family transcriptional regulator